MKPRQSRISYRYHKYSRKLRYRLAALCSDQQIIAASDTPVDVVIPIVEKDLATLPLCLRGVRECVANPLGKIYLVAPPSKAIAEAALMSGAELVNENDVLGYSARSLDVVTSYGQNRSGWIFQQLLKLSGNLGTNRYFLVIDADHILLQRHVFVDNSHRHVLYMSKEYNYPYYENLSRTLGLKRPESLSFVAHKMIFDKNELQRLKHTLEQRNPHLGNRWDEIIIHSLDLDQQSGFSEYETYGHFLTPDKKILLPWRQKTLRKNADGILPAYEELQKKYGHRYRSVTFPDYMKKQS